MAFIRRKKVKEYEYYQAVRNYRDSNGQHRQKVLCHLGQHNSIESAITAERENSKYHRELATDLRKRAEALKAELLDLYMWDFVDGEIPSSFEATVWFNYLSRYNYRGYNEEADIQIGMYEACLRYHDLLGWADRYDRAANAHEERLEKHLWVQREYF